MSLKSRCAPFSECDGFRLVENFTISKNMKAGRRRFLVDFGKQIGFAVSIFLAFLAGLVWNRAPLSDEPGRVVESPQTSLSTLSPRFGAAKAEPEDFYPVAEFRQQAAILIGSYQFLNTLPELYVDIAKAIDGRLPLFGMVGSEEQAVLGLETMRKAGLPIDSMHFLPLPANTVWVRDYAPFMIRRFDNSVGMVDAKYVNRLAPTKRSQDEEMASALAEMMGLPLRSIPLVLEGGNFLSNADGIVVTTSGTIAANQGYDFTMKQMGNILYDFLGVRNWAYVATLEGEPTGHADMFFAFLAKNIAVVGEIDPASDPVNAERLDEVAEYLSRLTTSLGPLKVSRIPMPPKWNESWRSYTNTIMANGILLMPSYSDVDPELEQRAENVYRSLLPGWQVKKVRSDGLVKAGGQLHCISYNVPRYVSIEGLLDRSTARAEFANSERAEFSSANPPVSSENDASLGF